jgi:L-fucose mutarotase
MLKNVDPLLTPDLLHALSSMGHGDEIAVVDAHYPADTAGRASVVGKPLHLDGADSGRAARAILSVLPLDEFVPNPAERMMVDNAPNELPSVQVEVQREIDAAFGKSLKMTTIPRKEYYERAKKVYAVIITGETRGWGCFILKKGLIVTPDAPSDQGNTHIASYTV